MSKIYKQRRCKPYQANGKTTFNVQNKPGVYMIYKDEEIVYIGFSGTNLYKTMYRHFQKWEDSNQIRVTYSNLKNITVRVVYTISKQHAFKLEKALIKKYKPKDNPSLYNDYEPTTADLAKVTEYLSADTKPIITHSEDFNPF
jgi:excinuclease UvrABC nuclease subunit